MGIGLGNTTSHITDQPEARRGLYEVKPISKLDICVLEEYDSCWLNLFSSQACELLLAYRNDTAKIQCRATHDPPAKRHSNGVSLAGRWWPAFRCLLRDIIQALRCHIDAT